ncbi:hypothetical protein AB0G04_34945 [Actinoplanes sp. NPDC023801]|uniref:hypothetical protein n=1 Tax=Actinoplanes sp. NPDC023801 TaxID=3154595 RepID=UPI0033DECB0C
MSRRVVHIDAPPRPRTGRQMYVAWAALLIAVPALFLGVQNHREHNRADLSTVEDDDLRFSSLVSFQDRGTDTTDPDDFKHVTSVTVRNSGPLPASGVVLVPDRAIRGGMPPAQHDPGYRPLIELGTIGPCEEVEIQIERNDLYRVWLRLLPHAARDLWSDDVPTWTTSELLFTVAGKDWRTTVRSVRRIKERAYDGVRSDADFTAARITAEEVSAVTRSAATCLRTA